MNQEFLRPRLVGRRFDEHTLPLDILKDFSALEEMLIKVVKPQYVAAKLQPGTMTIAAFDKKAIEKKSKLLRAQAETRGWLFREAVA